MESKEQQKLRLEQEGKLVTRATSDMLQPLQGKWEGYGVAFSTRDPSPIYFKEVQEYFPTNDKNAKIEEGFGGFTFIRTCWKVSPIEENLKFPYKTTDFKQDALGDIIHQETGTFVCDHQLFHYSFGDNPVYVEPIGYRKNSSSSRGYGLIVQGQPNKDNTSFTFSTDLDPNTFGVISSVILEKLYQATHYNQKLSFSNNSNTLTYKEIVNFDKQDDQSILTYTNKAQLIKINGDDNADIIIPFSYGVSLNQQEQVQSIELKTQNNSGILDCLQGTWEGYGILLFKDQEFVSNRPPIVFFYEKYEFWPTHDNINLTGEWISGFQFLRKIWRKKPKAGSEYAQIQKIEDVNKVKLPLDENQFLPYDQLSERELLSLVGHEETGSFIADHDKENPSKITGYRKNLSVARGQAIIARAEAGGTNENEIEFKTNSTDYPVGILSSSNLDKDFESCSYDIKLIFDKSGDKLRLDYVENVDFLRDPNKEAKQFYFNHRSEAILYKVSNENYMTKLFSE